MENQSDVDYYDLIKSALNDKNKLKYLYEKDKDTFILTLDDMYELLDEKIDIFYKVDDKYITVEEIFSIMEQYHGRNKPI